MNQVGLTLKKGIGINRANHLRFAHQKFVAVFLFGELYFFAVKPDFRRAHIGAARIQHHDVAVQFGFGQSHKRR